MDRVWQVTLVCYSLQSYRIGTVRMHGMVAKFLVTVQASSTITKSVFLTEGTGEQV